jgi:hypothetical protein
VICLPSNRHLSPPNCVPLLSTIEAYHARHIALGYRNPDPVIILLYLFHVI